MSSGYVYLLCDGEKFKIGMTRQKDIHKRISELQTGNPNEIYMMSYYHTDYPYRVEQLMHNKYYKNNIKNEWFDMTAQDVVNFKNNCAYYENIISKMTDNPFFKAC